MNTVLVVDNEPKTRSALCLALSGEGFNVQQATNGREAIEAYRQSTIDVVIADMRMPEMDGREMIHRLKQLDEHVAAIMLTAHGKLDKTDGSQSVEGVYNYFTKPLKNPDMLIAAVKGAIETRRLKLENQALICQLEAVKKDPKKRVTAGSGPLKPLNRNITQMQLLELDLLYASAPVGMCQIDGDYKFIKANKAMAMMAGTNLEDLMGRSVADIHPRLAKQLVPACQRIHESGEPMPSHVISLPGENSNNGSSYWLASSYPLILEDGTIGATSHFLQDISDLRQAQEHIRTSKVMLQSVFDGISDPLVMVDRHLRVRMLNRAAKDYYNICSYNDLLGKRCEDLFHDKSKCRQCKISDAVSSGQSEVFERAGHMAAEKVEKVTIYPLSRSATGFDGSIIQITDITETKAVERQIIQNEKLAALGLLVSGVAHEINNPNNFITFNIPILKTYMKAILAHVSTDIRNSKAKDWFGMSFDGFRNEIFKLIANLEHGTHRIADIVENLRTLVKAETGGKTRQPCDMVKIVGHVDALCRSDIQKYVKTFEVHCQDDLPMVVSDAAALEQILINLLINAAHAANKPDSKIMLSVAIKNRILKLEVEDNGAGMGDETLKKIFDPFFTTKDPGLGTGLGLSVCHSLINAMHGTLKVKSVLNSGTVFSVDLPVRFVHEFDRLDEAYDSVLTGSIAAVRAQ